MGESLKTIEERLNELWSGPMPKSMHHTIDRDATSKETTPEAKTDAQKMEIMAEQMHQIVMLRRVLVDKNTTLNQFDGLSVERKIIVHLYNFVEARMKEIDELQTDVGTARSMAAHYKGMLDDQERVNSASAMEAVQELEQDTSNQLKTLTESLAKSADTLHQLSKNQQANNVLLKTCTESLVKSAELLQEYSGKYKGEAKGNSTSSLKRKRDDDNDDNSTNNTANCNNTHDNNITQNDGNEKEGGDGNYNISQNNGKGNERGEGNR